MMESLFGEKKTTKQRTREAQREIKRSARDVERDQKRMKREEAQLSKVCPSNLSKNPIQPSRM